MVTPGKRSGSQKKSFKVTPGGKTVTHYKRKRPSPVRCAICKKPLSAVPKKTKEELKKLPKSKKRPNRPYGGNLCPSCMRKVIKARARG
ncbi:MAG: 50S ribosomal protein L34e [Candidatus Hydrothermarchaeales archaeon]